MRTREQHILILRHGQTEANFNAIIQGHQQTPLSPEGHRQAGQLARRLLRFVPRIQRLFASDLDRAIQTSDPIAADLGLVASIDPRWRERCVGILEGRPVAEAKAFRRPTGEIQCPGAETMEELHTRVHAALTHLTQLPERVIAVVTHGGPCREIIRMLQNGTLPVAGQRPPEDLIYPANCSITHLIRQHDNHWRVGCINDTSHLAAVTDQDAG